MARTSSAICRGFFVLLALIAASCGVPARAGPWSPPEGHGFVINSFGFMQAQNYAGIPNPAYGSGTFRRFEYGFYGEYGLADRLTLVGAAGLQQRNLDTAGSTFGVGDVDLGLRGAVWQKGNWAVAAQGVVKLPTGYDPYANPALGNGQVDLEPRLLIGRGFSLGSWPAFFDAGVGYRFRTGSPSDQLRFDATVGVHVAPRWMLMLQSYNIIGMQNEAPGGTDFNLSTLLVSAVYEIAPAWSVQLGGFSEIASRNYNTGNGVFAAIWWRF